MQPTTFDFSEWTSETVLQLAEEEVRFPASFDRAVWPRPEDLDEQRATKKFRNILELEPIRSCGEICPDHLARIAVALESFSGSLTQAVRNATECEGGIDENLSGWKLMGFDVLDAGLALSGLLNFGEVVLPLASQVIEEQRQGLNRFLLWPTKELAGEYRALLDQAVKAHAPFEIVALYRCGDL